MTKEKLIAVVCDYEVHPNRIGGMDYFFRAYNNCLKNQKIKVYWFFRGNEIFPFYRDFNIIFADRNSVESTFLKHLDVNGPFDIVVTHFLPLCTSFFRKVKKKGARQIIAVDHNPRPLEGFSYKKRIKNKIKGKLYSRYIDCFIGVSHYTTQNIIRDFGENLRGKTKVIHNGIDTSLFIKRTDENQGKFIVASHLRESKGIRDLIEAVYLLPSDLIENIRIDIYGDGPLEGYLKDMVQAYKLSNQIFFKGSSSQLPDIYHQYSYLLQPTYMECFSLSILESLAANVPVISTTVGGNLEVLVDKANAHIFNPGDIQEFSSILERVLRREIKTKNHLNELIELEFNLEKMVMNHFKVLNLED